MKCLIVRCLSILFVFFHLFGCVTDMKAKQEKAKVVRELGEAYLAENKLVPAYKEFQKAAELFPNDPHLHYDLGIFFFKRERFDLARDEYLKALKIKHDYSAARNSLGATYMALKEYDKAIQTLKLLLENYIYATPHYPNFLLGQAYYHKGDYKTALSYFDTALSLEPKYAVAYHWKGKTYLKLGKTKKAIEALESAIKQNKVYAAFYLDLGLAYTQAKNPEKAVEAYQKAIAIDPDSPTAKEASMAIEKFGLN